MTIFGSEMLFMSGTDWGRGQRASRISVAKVSICCLELLPYSQWEELDRKGFCITLLENSEVFYVLGGL